MGLFDPAWKGTNEARALRAVERAKTDDELLEIVRFAPLDSVKVAAVKRMGAKALLSVISDYWRFEPARKEARQRLSSEYPAELSAWEKDRDEKARAKRRENALHNSNPAVRLEALKSCNDGDIIAAALEDSDIKVCEEAMRKAKPEVFVKWLISGKRVTPIGSKGLWKKIDKLSPAHLETVINTAGMSPYVKSYACGKLGHQLGEKCVCTRCGAKANHDFDENNVCRTCGARLVEGEPELLTSQHVTYARRTSRTLYFPDGTSESLDPRMEYLVDEATLNWLFNDD